MSIQLFDLEEQTQGKHMIFNEGDKTTLGNCFREKDGGGGLLRTFQELVEIENLLIDLVVTFEHQDRLIERMGLA